MLGMTTPEDFIKDALKAEVPMTEISRVLLEVPHYTNQVLKTNPLLLQDFQLTVMEMVDHELQK